MRIVVALALSLALAAPAFAETGDSQQPPATPTAKPAKEKKICRKNELAMGSRVSMGRICKTASEWAAEDAATNNSGVRADRAGAR